MNFDLYFVEEMGNHLQARLRSKTEILRNGGEQALAHSPNDLARIRWALARIVNGSYGLCTHCGTGINPERLRIIPEALYCTDCARSIEAH